VTRRDIDSQIGEPQLCLMPPLVSDIALFVLKGDVKLQLTN